MRRVGWAKPMQQGSLCAAFLVVGAALACGQQVAVGPAAAQPDASDLRMLTDAIRELRAQVADLNAQIGELRAQGESARAEARPVCNRHSLLSESRERNRSAGTVELLFPKVPFSGLCTLLTRFLECLGNQNLYIALSFFGSHAARLGGLAKHGYDLVTQHRCISRSDCAVVLLDGIHISGVGR